MTPGKKIPQILVFNTQSNLYGYLRVSEENG